jgi:transcription antitermination factor NusG
MQLDRLRAPFATLVLAPFLAVFMAGYASAQAPAPAGDRALGTVTKLDAAARTLTVKTDAGQEVAVSLAANTNFRRVAPGETDLRKAASIALTDVSVGDRVLARGKPAANQGVEANLIVVMSQGDIKKKQAEERADWDRRGVAGLVTAVSPDSVTIETRTLAGTKNIVIAAMPDTMVRRYSPDSIKFSDATPAKLSDIQVKDQVRARGDKVEEGAKVNAAEIIFGTFKTRAGVILSVDPATNEIRMNDLETKKPITVKIGPDSVFRKLQPQMAQTIALRVHGSTPEAVAAPAGGPPRGGERFAGGGRGGFGGGFGGRGGGGGDLSQMIERSPAATLADVKAGDAIVVLSTENATPGNITAITLLAGVEPILTRPGSREMSLGGWSLDAEGGGGGQ